MLGHICPLKSRALSSKNMLPIQLDSTTKKSNVLLEHFTARSMYREGEKRKQGDNGIEKAIRLSYG